MSSTGFIFSDDSKTLLNCDFSQLGTDIIVPEGTVQIANGVFAESNVISVTLPSSVTTLGQNVFSSAEFLKSVVLSDNISKFEPFTFSGCFSLQDINIPKNVKSFPEGLFLGCSSLEHIPFCNDLSNFDSLEIDVFRDCENLLTLKIPNTVKKIKTGALAGCTSLTSIVFPTSLESIDDRSLANLKSLSKMSFDGTCQNFFIDNEFGCLYQSTPNGSILIKAPATTTSVKLIENTYDLHIDAFDSCQNLQEIYLFENTPEDFASKVMELFPAIDINSYNNESTCEELLDSENNSPNEENLLHPDDVNNIQNYISQDLSEKNSTLDKFDVDIDAILNDQCCRNDELDDGYKPITNDELEFLFNNPRYSEQNETEKETNTTKDNKFDVDIDAILNDQCCRNDELDDGYRPVTMEELEFLFQNPVYADQNEQTNVLTKEEKKSTPRKRKTKATTTKDDSETTKKRKPRKTKSKKEEINNESITTQEPICKENNDEPRFIKALKSISTHQLILEEKENELENVYGNLRDLFVFADGVAPSTNEFSSHLVKFAKSVAKKYGFTKIYFFNDLPLDNPEFIYGLESFGNLRNVLYACDKSNKSTISDAQKELIAASGIELPKKDFLNVKETLDDNNLQYPVKILVHDNYIEGLLYCAEKYRQAHGIQ